MTNPDNQLRHETSPYLLQHADNPVNWHAWNDAALNTARHLNKPILLSIGYSACHWCHVMAHESFEDDSAAELMNELFINIKVDREERPDLDKIYQTAHSLLTGKPGGWPLTIFISPDNQIPFFAGTYFPDSARYNMPSFKETLKFVSHAHQNKQQDIASQNESLTTMLQQHSEQHTHSTTLNALPIDMARKQIEAEFRNQYGGYSEPPKFPQPSIIERSMRHWHLMQTQNQTDERIIEMALFSLKQMAMGGLYDHLGGGFCRYSTDEKWMIPHFEKMLYDNGQLLSLYSQAYLIDPEPDFRRAAIHTSRWIMREMQAKDGGYFSALDADSEGEEGKFYAWTTEQIKSLLNNNDYPVFARAYGLDKQANFEKKWHLHTYFNHQQLAKKFHTSIDDIEIRLEQCRNTLFIKRAQRIAPECDDKILCSWNALMIRGMFLCGRIFKQTDSIESAHRALNFIHQTLWQDKRLLATYREGRAHLNAYLDDYAYLLLALIEALQCQWRNEYLDWAIELADALLNNFEDIENGGFYFTSHDHEKLIQRSKSFSDDAMPSGNGIASIALQQLGYLLSEPRYLKAAERSLQSSFSALQQQPLIHSTQLHALENHLHTTKIIILRGPDDTIAQWQDELHKYYTPNTLSFYIPEDTDLPSSLATKKHQKEACAYICQGTHCLPVVTELSDILTHINTQKHNP